MIQCFQKQILRHLFYCLIFKSMVLVLTLTPTQPIRFHLKPNAEHCFEEQVLKGVLVTGQYELTAAPDQRTDLTVIKANGNTAFSRENVDKGRFALTADEDDTLDICFVSYLLSGHETGLEREISFEFKREVEDKNQTLSKASGDSQQDNIYKETVVEDKPLSDNLSQIKQNEPNIDSQTLKPEKEESKKEPLIKPTEEPVVRSEDEYINKRKEPVINRAEEPKADPIRDQTENLVKFENNYRSDESSHLKNHKFDNQVNEIQTKTSSDSQQLNNKLAEHPISSSLSEESFDAQTMTPTRSMLTVVDGTTFSDEDLEIDSSPTNSAVSATATKTPTISVNVNENNVNLNESDVSSLPDNSADNQNIEPSLSTVYDVSSSSEIPDKTFGDSKEDSGEVIGESENNSNIDENLTKNETFIEEESKEQNELNSIKTGESDSNSAPNISKSETFLNELKNTSSDKSDESSHLSNHTFENQVKKKQTETSDSQKQNNNKEIVVEDNQLSDNLSQSKQDDPNIVSQHLKPEVKEESSKEPLINSTEEPIFTSEDENINTTQEPVINRVEEQKADPTSDQTVNFVKFKNNYTSDESSHLKNHTFENQVNESQTNTSSDSQQLNNYKETVVEDNPLSDNLFQNEPNVVSQYLKPEVKEESSEEPLTNPIEEPVVKSEDEYINTTEESVINREEEPKSDPIKDQTESFVEFENKIPNPSVDPIVESQYILKGMDVTKAINDIIPEDMKMVMDQLNISAQVVAIIFIIASCWCLTKILLSLFISSKKETELRNLFCKCERQIYYFEAEKQKLQTEIERETEKARISEERMQTAEHKVIPLEKEFIKLKNERDHLHQKVVNLENDLEGAAEAGLEANRLLNDFLTSQKENINLNSSVDALQQQITKQAEIVTKYESTAKQKEKENRELKEKFEKMSTELDRLKNLLKECEHNLHTFQTNNEELKSSKNELNLSLSQLEEEYSSLQMKSEEDSQRNEELMAVLQKLTQEVTELREQSADKDREIESWKQMARLSKPRKHDINSDDERNEDDEEVDQIDSENYDQSVTDLYDIVKMDIQLKNLTNDKNDLLSKLQEVSEQCRQLNDKINFLEVDNQSLKTEKETAVQERTKAQNKLEVLTEHYRTKELEFGKEIGVQQVQRLQKEETADSLTNQLVDLKEENTSLRSQLQSMKKEIDDTERKYKSNINQLEKQVHENWILARNAERKVDEAKAEAAVLRQTLTMSVKSPVDGYVGDGSFMDDSASSISDHFGSALPPPPPPPPMPPPPGMFNPMMPPMHMQFNEENDASALWNQTINHNMNPMQFGGIPPPYPPMPAFNPIPNNISMDPNVSFANSVSFVPQMQQMGNNWDSTSNRDTYSPSSHRSTSSPHLQYNMYSQPNTHYSNPMTMTSNSSPMTNSSMSGHFQNQMSSVTSPIVNSSPTSRAVLSEPTPMHWTQPQRPNGNIPNLNYSQNQFNESSGSSRPTSRNERNDSLHTSIV